MRYNLLQQIVLVLRSSDGHYQLTQSRGSDAHREQLCVVLHNCMLL